jgi:hypothetical protein
MTQTAVSGVQILEFAVTHFVRCPVVVMTLRTGCRLGSGVERMMAGGTGVGVLSVCSMIEQDGSGRVSQIDPIRAAGGALKQVAGDDRNQRDGENDRQRAGPVSTILKITTHDYPLK